MTGVRRARGGQRDTSSAARGLTAAVAGLALAASALPAAAEERAPYAQVLGAVTVGEALRFNNPYRLHEPLGSTAESVSLAAPYLDVALAGLVGRPWGAQHGLWAHGAFALAGISQAVLSPSYVFLWRFARGHSLYGRVGPSFVLGPDANVGGELAGGGLWMLTGAVGLTAELNGSAFYGAATREVSATLIPLLALQAGVVMNWEALP